MSILSQNLIKHKLLSCKKIGRSIGHDTYFIVNGKQKYVIRIENNSANSRIKIDRHIYFLNILSRHGFVQKIAQEGMINGHKYFITNFLQGQSIFKLKRNYSKQINSILNIIHLNKFIGGGRFDVKTNRGEYESWIAYIDSIIKKLNLLIKNHNISNIISSINSEYNKIKRLIKKRNCNRLLHADLNKENILRNNKRVFFLDWENAVVGDPLADYAIMDNFWGSKKSKFISQINLKDRKLFLFYKKMFLLLEIFYKIKYSMKFSEELKKLQSYFV